METETAQLWCIRYVGPDDITAAESREAAERMAEDHRSAVRRMIAANPGIEAEGISAASMAVVVEPWPWSAEAHAEDLKRDN